MSAAPFALSDSVRRISDLSAGLEGLFFTIHVRLPVNTASIGHNLAKKRASVHLRLALGLEIARLAAGLRDEGLLAEDNFDEIRLDFCGAGLEMIVLYSVGPVFALWTERDDFEVADFLARILPRKHAGRRPKTEAS